VSLCLVSFCLVSFCRVTIPQGTILGPLLFTLYTTPLSSHIHSYKLDHHLYVDDTQVYISLTTTDTDLSLKQLGDCLSDISVWMTNNKLRLNPTKTDFIIIDSSRQRSKLTCFFPTNILSHSITPSDTLRNGCWSKAVQVKRPQDKSPQVKGSPDQNPPRSKGPRLKALTSYFEIGKDPHQFNMKLLVIRKKVSRDFHMMKNMKFKIDIFYL